MEIPSTLCSNVYDFAFCPEPCYDRLVDLADPEDWGPGNRILKNYLSLSLKKPFKNQRWRASGLVLGSNRP